VTTRSPGTAASPLARAVAASLASVTLFAAVFVTAGPAAAAAGDEVTWGVRTAGTVQGTDRQNFAYTLEPGTEVSDALVVTNHAAEPLDLAVSAADGFTTTSGQLDLVTADTASVAVGAWSTFADGIVSLDPGASAEVPFTVTVPADATPGDYAGGILTALPRVAQEQGVTVDRRLGIRMHIRVLGDLAPGLTVDDLQVDYTGTFNPFGTGDAVVGYTLRNTGNTRLAAGQTVSLAGPFGLLPGTVSGAPAVPELLPGESWPVSLPVDRVFASFWLTATTVLTPSIPPAPAVAGAGTDAAVAAAPAVGPVEASAGTWAVPWPTLLTLLLLVGGIVLAVRLIRRGRAQRQLAEDTRVQDAVAEALRSRGPAAG
jgi:hypothetical protein